MKNYQLDAAGHQLMEKWEGFYPKPYLCPAKVWTQGIGSTINMDTSKRIQPTDQPITREKAYEWVNKHVVKYVNPVIAELIKVPLTQNQYNAVASFIYNTGGYYKDSKGRKVAYNLFNNINARMPEKELRQYWETCAITANGKKLTGLGNRRKDEVKMFFA